MPHTADSKYDAQIQPLPQLPFSVSSQWNVYVILQPAAEGDVPSSPEFLHASGKIGLTEIVLQFNAKEPCHSLCQIDTGAEVRVKLQAIEHTCQQHIAAGIDLPVVKHSVDDHPCSVSDHQL